VLATWVVQAAPGTRLTVAVIHQLAGSCDVTITL